MKKIYFLFSLWPLFAMGQVSTGFESGLGGEWDQFPESRWESSPEQPLSGLYSLHHSFDNTSSGNDRISFKTGIIDTNGKISWEFTLRYAYTTSSTNNWRIILASDKGATETEGSDLFSGYIFGVNITGSDDSIRLYAIQEGKLTRLCTGIQNFQNDIGTAVFHCHITRDSLKRWEIYSAKEGSEFQIIASFPEPELIMPVLKYFMLSYSYTSSKDRLLWFDDLSIQAGILNDTIPPEISDYKIPDSNRVILEFSESIDTMGFKKEQLVLIPGYINPEQVIISGKSVSCFFKEEFLQRMSYQLIVSNFRDKEGNLLIRDSIDFIYYLAEKNDLVFTEIMADPNPVVYLPEQEYIEIYNRSEFSINLDSFILQTGKKEWIFPDVNIFPGDYLVVTSGNNAEYNTLPLFTSSSIISNDGLQLFLKNKSRQLITATEFYSSWYQDDFKSQGGWSLERIDANNLCGGKENWRESEDLRGGTPGSANSVQALNPDISKPNIERLEFVSENKIRLVFSEIIDPFSLPAKDSFVLTPGSNTVDSLIFQEYFCTNAEIAFKEKFQTGAEYQLIVPEGICDCAGNQLQMNDEAIRFGLPSSIGYTDLIISEVLFSALPACPEYIEIYNLSGHLIDLSDIRIILTEDDETGVPAIPLNLPVLFFPGEYLVLCKNRQALLSCHDVDNPRVIIEVMDLPTLPDAGACIRLLNKSLETVDIFCYKSEDEFPMLSDSHGVSLERLLLDRKTGDQSLWHSASSIAGFGTPGAINSQSISGLSSKNKIELTMEMFTPDNDGFNDMLEIQYSLDKEGFVGTLAIFDPSGRNVCFLGENEIMGTSGVFIWDGRDDTGYICKTGLYIIYVEIWNLKGEKEKFKKSVVLVRQ